MSCVPYSTTIEKPKSKKEIEERVIRVVAAYDKITADKVNILNFNFFFFSL